MNKFCCRIVAATALLGVMTMSTACYGPFALTKNVYRWNSNMKGSGEINDKWMKELVFFGLIIVPAYQFSALLDMFIFNSMHFWTGESPIKESSLESEGPRVATIGETTVRWTPFEGGATVAYERHGVIERRGTIVAGANGYQLIDEHGKVLSEAQYGVDNSVRFLNADCQVVKQFTKEQLRSSLGGSLVLLSEVGG